MVDYTTSVAQYKILKKILGRDYIVDSSAGHIRDLPEKQDHLTATQKKLPYAKQIEWHTR